jgi:RNA polymerase sigma-70 factor (ECF subfamily)
MAVDRLRRKKRLREMPLSVGAAGAEEDADFEPAGQGDEEAETPLQQTVSAEFLEAYRRALAELSEEHRAVFLLHAVEGMRYREIAEVLGLQIGTVMSRLFYARKQLQSLLAPYRANQAEPDAEEAEVEAKEEEEE